jgi:hypothetical protein
MSVILEGTNPCLTQFHAPPWDRYDEGRLRHENVPLDSHVETAAGVERTDPRTILGQQNLNQVWSRWYYADTSAAAGDRGQRASRRDC